MAATLTDPRGIQRDIRCLESIFAVWPTPSVVGRYAAAPGVINVSFYEQHDPHVDNFTAQVAYWTRRHSAGKKETKT